MTILKTLCAVMHLSCAHTARPAQTPAPEPFCNFSAGIRTNCVLGVAASPFYPKVAAAPARVVGEATTIVLNTAGGYSCGTESDDAGSLGRRKMNTVDWWQLVGMTLLISEGIIAGRYLLPADKSDAEKMRAAMIMLIAALGVAGVVALRITR